MRGAAVMPAAALAVHQLRYWVAYGPKASSELADQGHSYLSSLTPWIVVLVAMALGGFVGRLAQAWRTGRHETRSPVSLRRAWLGATAALIVIYATQEFLEGLLESGHPAGLVGIFGHGGWWAIPAAVAVGGLLALLIRGGRAALALAARLARPLAPRVSRIARALPRPRSVVLRRVSVLAARAAGRAPPSLLSSIV
jgi:hypothetical protein